MKTLIIILKFILSFLNFNVSGDRDKFLKKFMDFRFKHIFRFYSLIYK
jgi:hypothetical protein